jgi:hypothetical protein
MTEEDTEKWAKVAKKTNPLSGFVGGISGWFGKLTGKPVTARQNEPPDEIGGENSVTKDLSKLRIGVGKVISKTSDTLSPVVTRAKVSAEKADKTFWKKILKIFIMVFFLIFLLFILIGLVSYLLKGGNGGKTGNSSGNVSPSVISTTLTPSPQPYVPFKPSVYVDDPDVLQLEQDISVLERQLTQDTLRESKLIPPSLDFNVKF